VVSTRPYVVRAAPGHTPNPGIGLPSASTGRYDDQRRASQPARSNSASWRTSDFVDHEQGEAAEAGELLLQPTAGVGIPEPGDPFGGGGE